MWRRMTAPNGELRFIIVNKVSSNHWQRSMLSLAAGSQAVIITDFGSSSSSRARQVMPGRRYCSPSEHFATYHMIPI